MQSFEYANPLTKEDAVKLLAEKPGEAAVLAGGTDLLSLMKDYVATPSRVVNTAVEKARRRGLKVGALRLINLWPFPDALFRKKTKYLAVELNWDGQLVREIQRAAPKDSAVHFMGICGELPSQSDLMDTFEKILKDQPLTRKGWKLEAW